MTAYNPSGFSQSQAEYFKCLGFSPVHCRFSGVMSSSTCGQCAILSPLCRDSDPSPGKEECLSVLCLSRVLGKYVSCKCLVQVRETLLGRKDCIKRSKQLPPAAGPIPPSINEYIESFFCYFIIHCDAVECICTHSIECYCNHTFI